MKIYIDILLIAAIYCFILDFSGAWGEITSSISAWLTSGRIRKPITIKPFSCSLCMTFWTGILYLLLSGSFTIPNLAYVCLVAGLTPRINDAIITIDELLAKLFTKLNKR